MCAHLFLSPSPSLSLLRQFSDGCSPFSRFRVPRCSVLRVFGSVFICPQLLPFQTSSCIRTFLLPRPLFHSIIVSCRTFLLEPRRFSGLSYLKTRSAGTRDSTMVFNAVSSPCLPHPMPLRRDGYIAHPPLGVVSHSQCNRVLYLLPAH